MYSSNSSSKTTSSNQQDDFTNNTDWEALARKLRQRNRELAKTLVQLEQALAEAQENLQSQTLRSHSADTLLAQQAEELNISQEQYTLLCRELETQEQNIQRQQIFIETISKHLEASQQQVAKLQRECALLQESNNEQSRQLGETEKQVQELHSRLYRQQQYTLQFKSALEQCLEVPIPQNYIAQQLKSTTASTSVVPKLKPIQPWSAQIKDSDRSFEYVGEQMGSLQETVRLQQDTKSHSKTKEIVLPSLKNLGSSLTPVPSNNTLDEIALPPEKPESTPVTNETSNSSQSDWSSLVIQPSSTSKKRKSKTAIDLPKFQRQS
jgi:DNA repair exonuclease SbcCD ATPase subunit